VHVDVLPGLKAGASTPPNGSAVAPAGPRPFLPALNGGASRAFLVNGKGRMGAMAVITHEIAHKEIDH